MTMTEIRRLLLLVACTLPLPAVAAHAHVHGQAKLDLAIEGAAVAIHIDSPLDSLLGFEHPPYTQTQVESAQAMAAKLRAAQTLFVTSPAAGCKLTGVKIDSEPIPAAILAGGTARPVKPGKPTSEHDDIDVDIHFICAKPENLHQIDVRLFDAFTHLHRVDVQMISPRGQTALRLTPDQRMLAW